MTNKFETIKAAVRTRLLAAGIKRVLDYPAESDNIGNFFPMAMLSSGDTAVMSWANHCAHLNYTLTIYIVTQAGITKTKIHEDYVVSCLNKLYTDNDMGGTAYSVNPLTIQFNTPIPMIMDMLPQNAVQSSAIVLSIQIKDTRHE